MIITLVPFAGLCNRLNAIVSALAYLEEKPEDDIEIYWHKWFHCNCRFSDLFCQLNPDYPQVKELSPLDIKRMPSTKLNWGIPGKIRGLFYDLEILPGMRADDFDVLTKGKSKIYINKDNRFCPFEYRESLSKIFIPTKELQDRITQFTSDWNNNVIGLHIRRTDNTLSIEQSPITHFYDVIDAEIEKNGSMKFYVATDDVLVKKDLIDKYGARILTMDLCLKRNSVQGMKDAVVDLYCLGSTTKIYGSAASSYSEFASKLYNIELIV